MSHPLANHFFQAYVAHADPKLADALPLASEAEAYRRLMLVEKKAERARRLCEDFVSPNRNLVFEPAMVDQVEAEVRGENSGEGDSIENRRRHVGHVGPDSLFEPLVEALCAKTGGHVEGFLRSEEGRQLRECMGKRTLTVKRCTASGDQALYGTFELKRNTSVVLGRQEPRLNTAAKEGTGSILKEYIQLFQEGDDGKVSREHCRLDVGPLCVLVTDLGSAKGSRLEGKKVKAAVWEAEQTLTLGGYTLVYRLGELPAGGSSGRKSMLSFLRPSRRSTAHARLAD